MMSREQRLKGKLDVIKDKFDYIIENSFDDTLEEKVKEIIERMI